MHAAESLIGCFSHFLHILALSFGTLLQYMSYTLYVLHLCISETCLFRSCFSRLLCCLRVRVVTIGPLAAREQFALLKLNSSRRHPSHLYLSTTQTPCPRRFSNHILGLLRYSSGSVCLKSGTNSTTNHHNNNYRSARDCQ
jgi:hypothetical protein